MKDTGAGASSLRESLARLRGGGSGGLAEEPHAVVYAVDLRTGAIQVAMDEQMEALLGFTRQEWESDRTLLGQRLHPEDAERVLAAKEKATNRGEALTIEYRLVDGNGATLWVHDHSSVVCDDGGCPTHLHGVAINITARRRVEAALRESNQRFDRMVNRLPHLMFRWGHGGLEYISPSCAEMTGYTQEELFANPFPGWLIVHPDDRGALIALAPRLMEGPLQFEARLLRKDGRVVWAELHFLPVCDEQGRLLAIEGVTFDISERKSAQQALQASDTRYRHMFEHAAVSLWEEDCSEVSKRLGELRAQGVDLRHYMNEHPEFLRWIVEHIKVLDVNQHSLQLFGARTKEQLLNGLSQICLPETYAVFVDEALALADGREQFRAEVPVQTLDGRRRHVLASIAFPPRESPRTPTLVSLVDITESKQAEEALLNAERSKREAARAATDAERRRLARELHDGVLQDLGAIKLILEAERRRGRGESFGVALERIAAVIREVRTVVEDLRPGDLSEASLEEAIAAHARWLTHPRGIALELELEPEVGVAATAVRDLYRIAQEALANALRHGKPRRVVVRLRTRQRETVLEIEDDGTGFDVTVPYCGVGLPGMRERAAALGGDLDIITAVGRGTTVRVAIPSGAEVATAPAAPAALVRTG
jgi:PAS domain S-box-containing protein